MTKQELAEILVDIAAFLDGVQSVALATVNEHGEPLSSYAPFARDAESGDFFVLVSDLSAHTTNLLRGRTSLLASEDESAAAQIYARTRVGFQCDVSEIPRKDPQFSSRISALKARHGEIIDTLVQLADFRLLRLSPETGTFVRGFGQAYEIDPALTSIRHIVPGKSD